MDLQSGASAILAVFDKLPEEVSSEYLKYPLAKVPDSRRRKHFECAALQTEMNLGKCERVVRAVRGDLAQLVGFRPHELAPRRHVIEKIFDRNLSAAGNGNLTARGDGSSRYLD